MLRELPERRANVALARALNKAAANVQTSASVAIRRKRALRARVVKEAFRIVKATKDNLRASLVLTGRPIPLRDYGARQTKKGVTVAVSPGPRKLVSHRGNRGFIVGSLSGHVFARQGDERLPIKKLFGPSLPATFVQDEVRTAWEATARDAIVKRTIEEARYEIRKAAGA